MEYEYYYPFTYYPFAQSEMILAPHRSDAQYYYPFAPLDEVFVRISNFMPDIRDYYWISNYGRVYNSNKNIFVNQRNLHGYMVVSLDKRRDIVDQYTTTDLQKKFHRKIIEVHKLVCMGFVYQSDISKIFVNHINGRKAYNFYKNLEWVTRKENSEHAANHDLVRFGNNANNHVFMEDQVYRVCELLELGMDNHSISRTVFGMEMTPSIYRLINNIQAKRCWIRISRNFNIPKIYEKYASLELVHKICQYFQINKSLINNKNISNAEILQKVGINCNKLNTILIEVLGTKK